jgi:hypothetical protein
MRRTNISARTIQFILFLMFFPIVYDCSIIICRLVTKHESNNKSTGTPNESPKHKRLLNKVYVPTCGCFNRKKYHNGRVL